MYIVTFDDGPDTLYASRGNDECVTGTKVPEKKHVHTSIKNARELRDFIKRHTYFRNAQVRQLNTAMR